MRLLPAVLYTALLIGANAAMAGPDAARALRHGDMRKLNFATPAAVPDTAVTGLDGGEARLADFAGRYTLVNFWATWCAPCRREMPGLAALQRDFGGDAFQVVTVATGRNPVPAVKKFLAEAGVDNLPVYLDPRSGLARQMGILGLPITVILDPEGREIARLIGDADWSGDSARAVIGALMEAPHD